MERNKGSSDYSIEAIKGTHVYIECASEAEYLECLQLFEKAGILWQSGHKPTEKNYWKSNGNRTVWFEKTAITNGKSADMVSGKAFIAANTKTDSVEYKVGDWIYLHKHRIGSCYRKQDIIGTVSQIEGLNKTLSDGIGVKTKIGGHWYLEDIRLAESHEIPGYSSDWQIGDVLPEVWLNTVDTWFKDETKYTGFEYGESSNRKVIRIVGDLAEISGTSTLYLKPKSNYPTYPGNKVEEKKANSIWKSGDRFYHKVEPNCIYTITRVDANTLYFNWFEGKASSTDSIDQANKNVSANIWIKIAPEEQVQQPIDDRWYVKCIDADRSALYPKELTIGKEYEVAKFSGDKIYIVNDDRMNGQQNWHSAKFGEKYQKTNTNNLTINQKQAKTTNSYEKDSIKSTVNNSSIRYTGTVICANVSQVRHTEVGRKGGISCGNSKSLIGTGN